MCEFSSGSQNQSCIYSKDPVVCHKHSVGLLSLASQIKSELFRLEPLTLFVSFLHRVFLSTIVFFFYADVINLKQESDSVATIVF